MVDRKWIIPSVALLTSSKGSEEVIEAGKLFWGQVHLPNNLSARTAAVIVHCPQNGEGEIGHSFWKSAAVILVSG